MKFLQTFSAVLCALSLEVSAIPTAGSSFAPKVRPVIETPNYKAAHAANPNFQVGEIYAYTLKSRKENAEQNSLIRQSNDRLDFKHIYLVVGHVSEKFTGPPNRQTLSEKDFEGMMYDMRGIKKVHEEHRRWKADNKRLEFVKVTTRAKQGRLARIGTLLSN